MRRREIEKIRNEGQKEINEEDERKAKMQKTEKMEGG